MIIKAKSDQDVVNAVKFAAQNKFKVATRSGGHNSSGPSLRDGGVLIDLSALNDIQIDVSRQIASIQSGVMSAPLITAAREKGLSFPVPHCPSVGLGGFLMGGGFGWNYAHRGGMSCFSVEAAEVVTAGGKLVTASADQNPDLLWAIRGGGPGFFGVVTRFHLKLYPVPKAILANSYIHPLSGLANVTTALDKLMAIRDDRAEVLTLLLHNPDAPPDVPPEEAKICFVSVFAFADSTDEAKTLLAPFVQSELARQSMVKVENQEFTSAGLYGKFFSQNVAAGRSGSLCGRQRYH